MFKAELPIYRDRLFRRRHYPPNGHIFVGRNLARTGLVFAVGRSSIYSKLAFHPLPIKNDLVSRVAQAKICRVRLCLYQDFNRRREGFLGRSCFPLLEFERRATSATCERGNMLGVTSRYVGRRGKQRSERHSHRKNEQPE